MNEKNIQGIYFYTTIQNHINGHLSEFYNCLYKIEKKNTDTVIMIDF